jgi:hypothetical protein
MEDMSLPLRLAALCKGRAGPQAIQRGSRRSALHPAAVACACWRWLKHQAHLALVPWALCAAASGSMLALLLLGSLNVPSGYRFYHHHRKSHRRSRCTRTTTAPDLGVRARRAPPPPSPSLESRRRLAASS